MLKALALHGKDGVLRRAEDRYGRVARHIALRLLDALDDAGHQRERGFKLEVLFQIDLVGEHDAPQEDHAEGAGRQLLHAGLVRRKAGNQHDAEHIEQTVRHGDLGHGIRAEDGQIAGQRQDKRAERQQRGTGCAQRPGRRGERQQGQQHDERTQRDAEGCIGRQRGEQRADGRKPEAGQAAPGGLQHGLLVKAAAAQHQHVTERIERQPQRQREQQTDQAAQERPGIARGDQVGKQRDERQRREEGGRRRLQTQRCGKQRSAGKHTQADAQTANRCQCSQRHGQKDRVRRVQRARADGGDRRVDRHCAAQRKERKRTAKAQQPGDHGVGQRQKQRAEQADKQRRGDAAAEAEVQRLEELSAGDLRAAPAAHAEHHGAAGKGEVEKAERMRREHEQQGEGSCVPECGFIPE